MPELCDDAMLHEADALRAEMAVNRKFIFERPLIIVTAGFVGVLTLSDTAWAVLLMIPVLGILLFNLWFTANRLRSSARIVAYLQLVHEPNGRCPWIGWENAVRLWRIEARKRKGTHCPFPKPSTLIEGYDVNRFYRQIHLFHTLVGIVASCLLLTRHASPRLLTGASSTIHNEVLAAGAAATALFALCCWFLRDANHRIGIEVERARWLEVLGAVKTAETAPKTHQGTGDDSRDG